MKLKFKVATENDILAITELVNNAYRPNSTLKGWTHESDLISGDRTNIEQIRSLFKAQSFLLLTLENDTLVSCVHLEIDGDFAYIGMLATNPQIQGLGYGKQMLEYAETFAKETFEVQRFVMKVLLIRKELLEFYLRRGYKVTDTTYDYPIGAGVGQPKVNNLKVGILEKVAF
jgi:N-acetylglutamate synthase-like GNAT family acetyltransferase